MKKLLAIFLAIIMLSSTILVPVCAADAEVKLGDVNSDGKITLNDIRIMLQYIAWNDLRDEMNVNLEAADYNQDDKVNLHDAAKILNYLAWIDEATNLG